MEYLVVRRLDLYLRWRQCRLGIVLQRFFQLLDLAHRLAKSAGFALGPNCSLALVICFGKTRDGIHQLVEL